MSRRDYLRLITALVGACVAAGCGDDDVSPADGGLAVDAEAVEGGLSGVDAGATPEI